MVKGSRSSGSESTRGSHVKGSEDCRKTSESVWTSSESACVGSHGEECHVIVGSRVGFLERRQNHSRKYMPSKSFIHEHGKACVQLGRRENTTRF